MSNNRAWDFTEARAKCAKAARAQETAEDAYRTVSREYAEAEEAYRLELALSIIQAHNDGVAWTAAADLARGDEKVARLRKERDIGKGKLDAMQQALWRHTANRKDAQRFADWSQRRELAEAA